MSWIVKTSAYSHRNSRLAVEIKVNSQSITDNSTLLSYRVYADNEGYSTSYVAYYSRAVTINGTTVYSASNRINGYKNQTLKSGTIRIPHNSDGTKSINVSLSADIYSSSGNRKTGSQSITLPRIDRGIYNFKLGTGWDKITGPKTVTFDKYNSNATVQLVIGWWEYKNNKKSPMHNVTKATGESATNYQSGETIYIPQGRIDELRQTTPNNWKGRVYVQAWVRLNGKRIETHTLEVPNIIVSESKPSLSFTAEFIGTNQSLLGSKTMGVKGVHKLRLNFSASAKDYATIKRFEVEFEGKKTISYDASVDLVTTRPGRSDVKVTVYDSRDWSNSTTRTVEVLDYEKPSLNYKAYRSEKGQENPIGDVAQVRGTVNYHKVPSATQSDINSAWWKLSINNNRVNSSGISYSFSLPISEQKELTLTYGDKFTTSKIKFIIPIGQAPFVIGRQSVGINTVPPSDSKGLWINGDVWINGEKLEGRGKYSSNLVRYLDGKISYNQVANSEGKNIYDITEKGDKNFVLSSNGNYGGYPHLRIMLNTSVSDYVILRFKAKASVENFRVAFRLIWQGKASFINMPSENFKEFTLKLEADKDRSATMLNVFFYSNGSVEFEDFEVMREEKNSDKLNLYNLSQQSKNYSIVQNTKGAVDSMIETAITYHNNLNDIVYQNINTAWDFQPKAINGKYPHDCSSLVHSVLKGVKYENQIFFKNKNIVGKSNYDELNARQYRLSNGIATFMVEKGYAYKPNEDFSNLRAGDILFFKWDDSSINDAYLGIQHVGIYLGKMTSNSYQHISIDYNKMNTAFYVSDKNYMNKAILAARVPLPAIETHYKETNLLKDSNSKTVKVGSVSNLDLTEDLKTNQFYTVVIKGLKTMGIGCPILVNAYNYNSVLTAANGYNNKEDGDTIFLYFVTPNSYQNGTPAVQLRSKGSSSNDGYSFEKIKLVKGIAQNEFIE